MFDMAIQPGLLGSNFRLLLVGICRPAWSSSGRDRLLLMLASTFDAKVGIVLPLYASLNLQESAFGREDTT
jgi:hypothetical protein